MTSTNSIKGIMSSKSSIKSIMPSCCCSSVLILLPLLVMMSTSGLLPMVNGEFYSSVDSLEKLNDIESSLLQSFRTYSQAVQEDLITLRRFMERIKIEHEMAEQDVEDYLGNPINAFTLIERMVRDWMGVNDLLKFGGAQKALTDSLTQLMENSSLPDEKELKGTILGLARLQDTYDLKAEDMANGKGYGSPLNWRECFEIATTYTDEQRADLALSWLQLASEKLQKSQDSQEIKNYFNIQIKEHLAIVHHMLGRGQKALDILEEVLAKNPKHPARLTKQFLSLQPAEAAKDRPRQGKSLDDSYIQLCQGRLLANHTPANLRLKCRLDATPHPFFTLSPLHIEPVNLEPPITLYHNMLNDEQIFKFLNNTDHTTFIRSAVAAKVNGSRLTERRVSQQTWVNREENPIAALMYRMLQRVSGFNVTNAEYIQLANYGIGGQYEPHQDFLRNLSLVKGLVGDRIATNMFYLSDVQEGGYTVFPKLNVFVKPVKGTMVMWYNLHKSLEPDWRTIHGGCPVLKGTKRIANIWSRSGFQDVVRPCGLTDDTILQS